MSEREPILKVPVPCAALLLIMVVVHALQSFTNIDFADYTVQPVLFWEAPLSLHNLLTLFTYQFLHANWLHLGMNSAMLLAFGSAMIRMIGAPRFIIFYLLCGVIAALVHVWIYADQTGYLLGASGAISGAMGFVLWRVMQQPRARLNLLLAIIIMQPLMALVSGTLLGGEIAWLAHLAGFAAGIVLALALKLE